MSLANNIQNLQTIISSLENKAAGGDTALLYASKLSKLYFDAVFPDGYELTVTATRPSTDISELCRHTSGLRKLTLDIPTEEVYNANSFVYQSTSIEEVVLPDGIKFSTMNYFATNVKTLKRVLGRVDMTNVTNVTSPNIYNGCTVLEEVYFMPSTIKMDLNISHTVALIDDSVQSIVDGYADMTGQTSPILRVNLSVGEKMTDAQKAALTAKNVTLVIG